MDPSSGDSNDRFPARAEWTEVVLARVTECDDGVEQCTVAPLPTSERRLRAEWVSALGDAFVALEEMR